MKEMILNNAKNEGKLYIMQDLLKIVNQWRHGICAKQY